MQQLMSNQTIYNLLFNCFKSFGHNSTEDEYKNIRITVQYKINATISDLSKEERSFLTELLFDYFYVGVFGVHDQSKRDLLHEIKPETHRSIKTIGIKQNQPQSTTKKEENKMSSIDNKKAVQTITYVYGNDTAEMKDADYYVIIRGLEKEIKDLDGIENKPKKLIATIAEKQEAINSIVALMDSKE